MIIQRRNLILIFSILEKNILLSNILMTAFPPLLQKYFPSPFSHAWFTSPLRVCVCSNYVRPCIVISLKDYDPNRAYFCPVCHKQDDGSPMVGCDGCDEWCHWYVNEILYLYKQRTNNRLRIANSPLISHLSRKKLTKSCQ